MTYKVHTPIKTSWKQFEHDKIRLNSLNCVYVKFFEVLNVRFLSTLTFSIAVALRQNYLALELMKL